jgi:predicted metalloenzyme YecM
LLVNGRPITGTHLFKPFDIVEVSISPVTVFFPG